MCRRDSSQSCRLGEVVMSELMKLLRGRVKGAIEDNTGQRSNKTARWRQNQDKTSRWDDGLEEIKG